MVEIETILPLIQLVALILPANAILLQVLNTLFEEAYEPVSDEFLDKVRLKKSAIRNQNKKLEMKPNTDRWAYLLPKASMHFFIFAGFAFVAALSAKLNGQLILPVGADTRFDAGLVCLFIGLTGLGGPMILVRPSLVRKAGDWILEKLGRDTA